MIKLSWSYLVVSAQKLTNFLKNILSQVQSILSRLFDLLPIFLNPNIMVFLLLMFVFTGPLYYMTILLHIDDIGGAAWYDNTNWRHYMFIYFSKTGSTDVIWKILGPLLIAISAGRTFNDGLSWTAAIIFLWLIITYLNADYLVHLLELNYQDHSSLVPTKILENITSRGFAKEELKNYMINIRDLATTSAMIIVGVSSSLSVKKRSQNEV